MERISKDTVQESNSLRRWDRMVRSLWIIQFVMRKKLDLIRLYLLSVRTSLNHRLQRRPQGPAQLRRHGLLHKGSPAGAPGRAV